MQFVHIHLIVFPSAPPSLPLSASFLFGRSEAACRPTLPASRRHPRRGVRRHDADADTRELAGNSGTHSNHCVTYHSFVVSRGRPAAQSRSSRSLAVMHQQHPAATDGAERPLTASDATRQVHAEGDTVAAAVSDHASSSPVASESHIIDLTHAEPPPGPLNVALQYAMPADSDTQSAPFSAPAPSELVVATAAPPAVLPTVGVSIAAVPPPSSSLPPHLLLLHPQLHIKNHRVKKRPCHVPGCAQIIESDRERYDHMVKMHQM